MVGGITKLTAKYLSGGSSIENFLSKLKLTLKQILKSAKPPK